MEHKLNTMDGETLMNTVLPPIRFVISQLLPQGLHVLAGAPKVGKSWLSLWLCLQVAKGEPAWEFPTEQGDVLYFCLEDSYSRIQNRLLDITDDAPPNLFFATMSEKLHSGLEQQIDRFLTSHPDTALIVIDTLQKVRTASKDNAYANDYGDISLLKDFADRHALAVVVVHHIRKQGDSDVFNRVSGTTGLTGSADATFVLEKEHRASDTAALYAIGRDIEYQEFTLRFRECSWELVERKSQEQLAAAEVPPILFRLVAFMEGRREWSGTATELLTQMGEADTAPNVITKLLNEYHATVLRQNNVRYVYRRTRAGRRIVLSRGDGVDSGDGLSGMPSKRETAVTPVL